MTGKQRERSGGSGVAKGGQGGRGAKPGTHRKGAAVGSGGQGRKKLEGRGPTPPAEQRTKHPAARKAAAAARRAGAGAERVGRGGANPASATRPVDRAAGPRGVRKGAGDAPETVVGRNPVVEALRAKVPATALYVVIGVDADERVTEAVALAGKARLALMEVSRAELDRMTGRALHQGLALQVPPYTYLHPDDLLERALAAPAPLLVALDGVTDPRNLGAVVRSAAAFGAQGVLVPERRSAGMTAAAWRTSAGAAARLPVARCTNLARTLKEYREAGLFVAGLAMDGSVGLDDLELATEPLVLVVGSEGDGLGRLVEQSCDVTVSIPMADGNESLNAGIAAAVVLAEVARRRRTA
jgi:23S rRNA (guanosine2251-2'-O)-methyltransferase